MTSRSPNRLGRAAPAVAAAGLAPAPVAGADQATAAAARRSPNA
ncbi:hypothetical protein OG799_13475 [Micromonospora sp. NBC_00898]|nr:hypothetical protein OG799_13475 [Micromonospora sp. NBC_00898]